MYLFRNDYSFGAHPKVLDAVARSSAEGNPGYGFDPHCEHAIQLIRDLAQAPEADVSFFIGGTSVNFTAIAAFLRPWEGVFCPQTGHINGHESGAVEATGHKILPLPTSPDGKLRPRQIEAALPAYEDVHLVKPRLVYISQATETGGVYTRDELEALHNVCRAHDLLLFVDGARLGCALAAAGNTLTLADLARLADAFTIGGTKNGALMGEALVIPDPKLAEDLFRIKKQRGAVLAKGWLLGAQFEALFTDGLYFELARHSNAMAQRLQEGLSEKGISFYFLSPTNQIFPIVDDSLLPALREVCSFEVWGPAPRMGQTVIRLVASFATTEADVEGLLTHFPL